MNVTTVFSDAIVSASELRKNQKRWLEEAARNPVTVSYGRQQLAIVNRDHIKKLHLANHYTGLALKVCNERGKGRKSAALPWLQDLMAGDRAQFQAEFLSAVLRATVTGDWDSVQELLQDWQATAEAESHPEVLRALTREANASEYVALD